MDDARRHAEGYFKSPVDGLAIYHQSWLPSGPPQAVVLLVHGLGEHSGRYRHVAEALTDAGYAVHALDHRGHGRSGGRRVYVRSYRELTDDLAAFRAEVEQQHPGAPLVVLGHSMGANLAVGHVLDHQDGVAGLALSGAALQPGSDLTPVKIALVKAVAKVAPGLRPEGLDASSISRDEAVVQAYRDDPLVYTGKITAGIGAALVGAMQSFPARYPTLRLPILILHGTADRLASVEGARELERLAVDADVTAHYYEGLYHEVFNEPERQQVIDDLLAWLASVVSRP
jgi:acylglycerol lipase